ncbi:MAG: hypothetical protein JWN15_271 [Firmicutes bacterium]|nr:hypothetical protein [Bacillota bacterium]
MATDFTDYTDFGSLGMDFICGCDLQGRDLGVLYIYKNTRVPPSTASPHVKSNLGSGNLCNPWNPWL